MSWKKVGTIILVAHLDFHGESQPRVTAYLGQGPNGYKCQGRLHPWVASTHSFLVRMRPRQHTEAQIPQTAQPSQGSGRPAILLTLMRNWPLCWTSQGRNTNTWAWGLQSVLRQIYASPPHPAPITGSLRLQAHKSMMHPNPASHPFFHHGNLVSLHISGGDFILCQWTSGPRDLLIRTTN